MTNFRKLFLVCIVLDALLILACWAGPSDVLMVPFFVCGFQFLIGLILCCISYTRELGKALVLSGLIGAVVGFSVCSANFRLDTK